MRILLDENVPHALKDALPAHQCLTAQEMGWASISNGELLDRIRGEFDALVTLDRGIIHQHNHRGHPLIIAVLRVPNSRVESVLPYAEVLLRFLSVAAAGDIRELGLQP
ncbi:MAG: DUF5615 family PIN-like protein [Fimbriimonadales bacterium]